MDFLILGLLMLKRFTVYEMRKHIEMNFTSMSSNSMGSIQAAIKKLLQYGRVRFNEYVENGVNKKMYEITDAGREYFLAGISKPMIHKEKNMELIKLFFMGLVESGKRPELLTAYIAELNKELAFLNEVKRRTGAKPDIDDAYLAQIQENAPELRFSLNELRDIAFYQAALLELAVAKTEAELTWFVSFLKRVEGS